jgi:hypothetical protein
MKTILAALLLAVAFCANAETRFSYTVEYVRSPNLPDGCPHYIGRGCELPPPFTTPLDAKGCMAGEVWNGSHCSFPKVVRWQVPDDLPAGCPTRKAPGCEIPNQPPLTSEDCYFHERLISIAWGFPIYGQRCMVRVIENKRLLQGVHP